MSLLEDVTAALKDAMRNKDTTRLDAIRALRGEIILEQKKADTDLSDEAIQKMIKTMIKQRQDAISQFRNGGRDDLADKDEAQIKVLKEFMPEELSLEALTELVEAAIAESAAASMKDMGKVMPLVMKAVQQSGKDADGRMISDIVKAKLQ